MAKQYCQHRKALFLLAILLWLVSSCTSATTTPTETPTILPSATQVIVTTSTPTPESTRAASQTAADPTSAITVAGECLTLQEQIPSDLKLEGVLVRNSGQPYLDNLENHLKYGVPLRGGGNLVNYYFGTMAVSPNGKRLAYLDTYLDTSKPIVRTTGYALRVINSTGHSLNMDYWPITSQGILGWKDNENLVIQYAPWSDKNSGFIILNPFTGSWKEFQQPAWLTQLHLDRRFSIKFNPTLDMVILGMRDHSELRDVESGDLIFGGDATGKFIEYAWSPDGTMIVAATGDGKTIHVIQDESEVFQVNVLEEKLAPTNSGGGVYYKGLSWSPDSKKILAETYDGLFVIDLEKNKILKLCFNDPQLSYTYHKSFASPDGRYAITHMFWKQKGDFYNWRSFDILIDLDKGEAYQLPTREGDDRIVWLAAP